MPIDPPDDDPTRSVKRRSLRLAARRWRLWWRYQLRMLRSRGPLRRLRVLTESNGGVAFANAQLRAGRLAGRWYLRAHNVRERARIERARVPDRLEPTRTTAALLARQRPLLIGLAVLIAAGLGLDALVRTVGVDLTAALGIEGWLRDTFARPTDDTLRNLLAAAAGGTATILGLVLSISLIVWQATADRYRSTSIVAFLLRERTASAVVRLLALAFAYSLWVLALLEVLGGPAPYVSAFLALVLSTAAVLSLLSYRQAGLLGYMPAHIAESLRREIVAELRRAQRAGAGRSVEDYSRRVVAADLQILHDLLERLTSEQDFADVAAVVGALDLVLAAHLSTKHRLHPDSLFFERRAERLTGAGADVEGALVEEGLMTPTQSRPDHVWLERRVFELIRPTSAMVEQSEIAEALFQLWARAVQMAVRFELPEVAEAVLADLVPLGDDHRLLASAELSEDYLTAAWILVELAGTDERASAEAIVATRPWDRDADLLELPWSAQAEARDLGARIRREIAITDRVVTPTNRMAEEVGRRRAPEAERYREHLVRRALSMCRLHLGAAIDANAAAAPTAARMTLRVLLRIAHHELAVPDVADVAGYIARAGATATGIEADDLRKDSGRAARALAEAQQWDAAYALVEANAIITALASAQEPDALRGLRLMLDSLFTIAIIHGWGELLMRADHVAVLGRYVQPPWADLDRVSDMLDGSPTLTFGIPTVEYYHWIQPLSAAVRALPTRFAKRSEHDFGDVVPDHPSTLFRANDVLFGPENCLEHLVAAVKLERDEARSRLVKVLRLVRDRSS